MIVDLNKKGEFILGVIGDTHVPDRVGALHPDVLPTFKDKKVNLIVHAGDIVSPRVITALETVAQVFYVRGNRDFLMRVENKNIEFRINQKRIFVAHGHGGLLSYLWDKIPYWLHGYRFSYWVKKLSPIAKDSDIVIYGHTHAAENQWVNGKLFFNSGSAYNEGKNKIGPSVGLIKITEYGEITSEILSLKKLQWKNGRWIPKKVKNWTK